MGIIKEIRKIRMGEIDPAMDRMFKILEETRGQKLFDSNWEFFCEVENRKIERAEVKQKELFRKLRGHPKGYIDEDEKKIQELKDQEYE